MTHLTLYKSLAIAALVTIAPVAAAQTYANTAQEADAIRMYQAQQRASAGYTQPQAKNSPLTVTPATTTVAQLPANAEIVPAIASHTVGAGDTLYNIGRRYGGIKPSAIMNANKLNGSDINIGQVLIVPGQSMVVTQTPPSSPTASNTVILPTNKSSAVTRVVAPLPDPNLHGVLPGDTLYSIARRSCVTPDQIAALSNISVNGKLQPGQVLRLPVGHCAP
ncbi:LysM peptidoglycan-binding domain-containing protein [Robiginitomaculum antarcticum]|uniref:LysM peptidoglycan-binding domain-containing protein n=1 Tax=Robiginitomaculum antarcticum TaxID=437507 RepID=UPI0003A8CD05|nr:LysM peptidoglycan-binding domain-containing protein [Robiginitomaculum antarcticum]